MNDSSDPTVVLLVPSVSIVFVVVVVLSVSCSLIAVSSGTGVSVVLTASRNPVDSPALVVSKCLVTSDLKVVIVDIVYSVVTKASEVLCSSDVAVVVISVLEDKAPGIVLLSITVVVSGLGSLVEVDSLLVVNSDFVVVVIFLSVPVSLTSPSEFVVSSVISVGSVVVDVSEVVDSFGIVVMVVFVIGSVRSSVSVVVGDVVTEVVDSEVIIGSDSSVGFDVVAILSVVVNFGVVTVVIGVIDSVAAAMSAIVDSDDIDAEVVLADKAGNSLAMTGSVAVSIMNTSSGSS